MFKRKRDFAVAGGIISIIFTFLFVGLAYAACPGVVCVDQPSGGTLTAGSTVPVQLTFNRTKTPASQFRLYVRCGGSPWQIITIRQCDYFGVCPPKYYWVIPLVGSTKTNCQLGAQVLDKDFQELGKATGGFFTISQSPGSPAPLSLDPPSTHVAAGGSAQFSVSGGTPPYTLNTDNNGIMTASFPKTFNAPVAGMVKNSYTCGSATTVTITVTDNDSTTATSTYIIDCP